MDKREMQARTKVFALRILRMVEVLPRSISGKALAGQIVRSATFVASNYRAACRSRSTAEFVAKLGIVEEEADETLFWLEMIEEAKFVPAGQLAALKQEADELVAITVASIRTARGNR